MATKIEWCDATANFITGCIHGCHYCYARRLARRFSNVKGTVYHRLKQAGLDPFSPAVHGDVIRKWWNKLSRSRRPLRIFVASMGDPCCDTFYTRTDEYGKGYAQVDKTQFGTTEVLGSVFKLSRQFSKHTFLVLSKNPGLFRCYDWPENVHLGTSVDHSNATMEYRLRKLYSVTGGLKWVSVEPLLDPAFRPHELENDGNRPDWVVVGGLSRGKIQPACREAAMRIGFWCEYNHIPVFYKDNLQRQFGKHAWCGSDWPQEYPMGQSR